MNASLASELGPNLTINVSLDDVGRAAERQAAHAAERKAYRFFAINSWTNTLFDGPEDARLEHSDYLRVLNVFVQDTPVDGKVRLVVPQLVTRLLTEETIHNYLAELLEMYPRNEGENFEEIMARVMVIRFGRFEDVVVDREWFRGLISGGLLPPVTGAGLRLWSFPAPQLRSDGLLNSAEISLWVESKGKASSNKLMKPVHTRTFLTRWKLGTW